MKIIKIYVYIADIVERTNVSSLVTPYEVKSKNTTPDTAEQINAFETASSTIINSNLSTLNVLIALVSFDQNRLI